MYIKKISSVKILSFYEAFLGGCASRVCKSVLVFLLSYVQNLNSTVLLLLHLADTLRQQNMLLNVRLDMDVRNLSMVMEEMKLVDTHHTQLINNFTIVKGAGYVPISIK